MTVIYENAAEVRAVEVKPDQNTDLNTREDRLLRLGNGIKDEVAFTHLRALGVQEKHLHQLAMTLVRIVQTGGDTDGEIAAVLGVVRTGINGTTATPEVR